MGKNYRFLLLIVLLLSGSAYAQNDPQAGASSSYCFAVEELEQMLHMPFRDAYNMLDAKGYQMGFSFDKNDSEYRDTIDGIVLAYSRMSFNDISDGKSALWLYTSQDGLSNIVEWERNRPAGCSLFPLFHQRGYGYDRSTGIFRGSGIYDGKMEHYEVQYYEDSLVLRITMKNIREIDTFVTQRREALEAKLMQKADEARLMVTADNYLPALMLLDSLRGNGHRVDSAVSVLRDYVVDQAEIYYFAKLDELVNNYADLTAGIECCDTLLLFTRAQDSVREIRAILQKQVGGDVYRYSELCPEEYGKVVSRLEELVNDALSRNVQQEEQRMKMNFTILTRRENETSGKVKVTMSSGSNKVPHESTSMAAVTLQKGMDELARSAWIKPIRQHGIYITARDQVSADIRWRYYVVKVLDECDASNQQLASAVKFIDDNYFSTFDTIRSSLTQQDTEVQVKGKVRKPTRREYTFLVNEKRMDDVFYTDISLTKFKTTSLLSWTPSLVIPGLGTKNQGLYSTATSRAIPFFLCTALAITGFVWENNGGKDVYRPSFEEGGAQRPWLYKDMGYYVGYGAGAIAATIYINELVEGINCSLRNLHRSKTLRKRMKQGPIKVQTESIRLQ